MRVYVMTSGRSATIWRDTLSWLPESGLDYRVVVPDGEASDYESVGIQGVLSAPPGCPVPGTNKPWAMEWVKSEFHSPGDWVWFMDDDLIYVKQIPEEEYYNDELQTLVNAEIAHTRLPRIFAEVTDRANKFGINLIGFGTTTNVSYLTNKWSTLTYIPGAMAIHRVGAFPPQYRNMEDWFNTYECLLRDGAVLRNNFVFPKPQPGFSPGGLGTWKSDRFQHRRRDIAAALKMYPGIAAERLIPEHPNQPRLPDLRLATFSRRKLEEARARILGGTSGV